MMLVMMLACLVSVMLADLFLGLGSEVRWLYVLVACGHMMGSATGKAERLLFIGFTWLVMMTSSWWQGTMEWEMGLFSLLGFAGLAALSVKMGTRQEKVEDDGEMKNLELSNFNIGLWAWNVKTNQNYYDRRWKSMLGYEEWEVENTQQAWVDLIHPDDVDACMKSIERYFSGERESHEVEFRMRTKSGDWKWVLTRGTIFKRQPDGSPLTMIGTHTDITAMKKLEQDLKDGMRRLEFATRAGGVGVWVVDLINDGLEWDEQMFNIFGVRREEFSGLTHEWRDRIHEEDRERAIQVFEESLTNHTEYECEFRAIRKNDGEVRYIRALAAEWFGEDGKRTHVVGVNWDVTEERRASESLRAAKEAAEVAERAKGQFMAAISHELRTPMNGILGMADLLLDTPLTKLQEEMVTVMKRSGDTLLAIINDILDYSKIEVGNLHLHPAPFDLLELVASVARLLEVQARRKGVDLQWEMASELKGLVMGDSVRIEQVLTNLLGNAIKFTEKGHVLLKVRVEECGKEYVNVRLLVEDTGVGIPESAHHYLFQPFKQADQSAKRKFGGSGLGLSISQQIAEAMGSKIHFESRVGVGSKFWIDLKLPIAGDELALETFHGGELAKGLILGGVEFRPLKLLLVEDNEANQMVASMFLEQMGHEVIITSDGGTALEIIRDHEFDLILMDCQLPEMDGFEATRRIRNGEAGEHCRNVPIIGLTASGMPGDRERCMEVGMTGYALKPINRQELIGEFANNGLRLSNASLKRQKDSVPRSPLTLPPPDHELLAREPSKEVVAPFQQKETDQSESTIQQWLKKVPASFAVIQRLLEEEDFDAIALQAHQLIRQLSHSEVKDLLAPLQQIEQNALIGHDEMVELALSEATLTWEKLKEEWHESQRKTK